MKQKRFSCIALILCLVFTMAACSFRTPKAPDTDMTIDYDKPLVPRTEPTEETKPGIKETTEPTEPPIPLNPYGPMDFGYEGDYITCLTGESMIGIDVSYWQGDIDWQRVADAGIEFAIIRLAWRGSEQGLMFADEYAQINYEGAIAAGIKVGGYFFSQAISPEEAVEEAQYALDMIRDWNVEMPIIFDWEYIDDQSRTANMDAKTLTACSRAFCDTVTAAGYEAMIYFNPEQAWRKLNLEELVGYEFWLAMYNDVMDYPYKVHMWQYTDSGTVPGIQGPVDLNVYLKYE